MIDFMPGDKVEEKSLAIIDKEAGAHGFDKEEWPVVRRMIHTTADFSIMDQVQFCNQPVREGVRALKRGAAIVSDSNMIKSGISVARLEKINPGYRRESIVCRVAEKDVCYQAGQHQLPRAIYNMRSLKASIDKGIVCIGNSPMALWEVVRLLQEENIYPALLIAMPVGFVNVVETKEMVKGLAVPYILMDGRRGGSTLVVAALNAIAIMAMEVTK
ncbi:MAG: precorrin-8X methylmutase [Thermodesulfobacteriota bacterium]|nr:precorrin-8X methylmutase [Thermodesulfobacteriota bacterium]